MLLSYTIDLPALGDESFPAPGKHDNGQAFPTPQEETHRYELPVDAPHVGATDFPGAVYLARRVLRVKGTLTTRICGGGTGV